MKDIKASSAGQKEILDKTIGLQDAMVRRYMPYIMLCDDIFQKYYGLEIIFRKVSDQDGRFKSN